MSKPIRFFSERHEQLYHAWQAARDQHGVRSSAATVAYAEMKAETNACLHADLEAIRAGKVAA